MDEQAILLQFLSDLQNNTNLTECRLFSHHWKGEATLSCIQQIVANNNTLQLFHLTDYNYGSDDPRHLLQLAAALQANKKSPEF